MTGLRRTTSSERTTPAATLMGLMVFVVNETSTAGLSPPSATTPAGGRAAGGVGAARTWATP